MRADGGDKFADFPQAKDFLRVVEPLLPAFRQGAFSYVAVLHNGEKVILRGRLDLAMLTAEPPAQPVETANLFAGHVRLDIAPEAIAACIERTLAGGWLPPVADQLLKLLPKSSPPTPNGYTTYYESSQRSHSHKDRHVDRLVIGGINQFQILSPRMWELDTELRDIGIGSVNELLRMFSLRGSDETTLDISVGPVVTIDPRSELDGRRAMLIFSLAPNLPPERLRCVIRNADQNAVGPLSTLSGESVDWMYTQHSLQGRWELDLPRAEVIDFQVIYAGRLQGEVRLADPAARPNPRAMIIGLVDPKLSRLEKLLTSPDKKEGRDFETAVAWLIHALGLAPVHVGAMSGMTDEPDILVEAPGDLVLIVECTIGVPDDGKLTRLISRSVRMREILSRLRGHEVTNQVISILVSSLPAEELVAARAKAEQHSVVLLCREDVQEALRRVSFAPDPEGMVQHWRNLAMTRLLTSSSIGNE
jgi:hypothetical protein